MAVRAVPSLRWFHLMFLLLCVSLSFLGASATNSKDSHDQIIWDPLPTQPQSNTSRDNVDAAPNGIFHVASEFINAVSPNEFPLHLLRGVINGTINPLQEYNQFINFSAGFIICFVIGILFIIIMPITGLIFCCCRCCENCGGKMLQREKYNTTCRRVCFATFLCLTTGLIILGLVGAFMANARMSTAIQGVNDTVDTNIMDVRSYINRTFTEFEFLAFEQFGYVFRLIVNDLDNVGDQVGGVIHQALSAKVNPALESIFMLAEESSGLQENLAAVNRSTKELIIKAAELQTSLEMAKMMINETLQMLPCQPGQPCPKDDVRLEDLTVAADFRIIDIEPQLNRVNQALSINITDLATQGRQEFDQIPERVLNESKTAVKQFTNELIKLRDSVGNQTKEFEDQIAPDINSAIESISPESGSPTTQRAYSELETVKTYDKYRFYVGIALCCVILIIVVCNFLGILFGECGRDTRDRPTERGCFSNFGGTLLLASVAFTFIFSAFVMLFTTLCFLVGGVSEKVICEPLETKSIFKEVIDYPYLIDPEYEYWLSGALFKSDSPPLTIESLINSCEANAGLYRAMKLSYYFNITAALDYRKLYPDIPTYLDTIQVDLSGVEIISPMTQTSLTEFMDSGVGDVNYTQYLEEIRKGITMVDLLSLATQLESYAVDPLPDLSQTRLREHAFTLRSIQRDNVVPMQSYVDTLEANLDVLLNKARDLSPLVNQSLERTLETQDFIQTDGPQIFRQELTAFTNRILNYADQYVLYFLKAINNEVGECKPIADVYDSLTKLVCNQVVDSFNGFWLSLGWCIIFFIPSIVFAVKLSKFYRRMRFYEDYYNAHDIETVPMKVYE
ncbi:prominin-1-A-like [Asterias amurensis]|uniref:prominin-1-A-like n=1 Tax=Asterias amurensis TaxID=7602 RepID=UPI003AB7959A